MKGNEESRCVQRHVSIRKRSEIALEQNVQKDCTLERHGSDQERMFTWPTLPQPSASKQTVAGEIYGLKNKSFLLLNKRLSNIEYDEVERQRNPSKYTTSKRDKYLKSLFSKEKEANEGQKPLKQQNF